MVEEFNNKVTPQAEQESTATTPIYIPVKSAPLYYTPKVTDPDLLVKKEYKSAANRASSSLLLFYGCGMLFQIVIAVLAVIFLAKGNAEYNEFVSFISATTFNLLLNSFYQCLFMTVPFIISAAISRQRASDILSYKKPKGILPLAILGLSGAMLCNLANSIISALFSLFGASPQGGNIEMEYSVGSFFLNILTIAVIPALFEEFAFRGIFMGLLRKRFSTSAAIIVSAAGFGLIHGNFAQMPFAFLMGLILGYLYAVSGSLWVPMLVHFLNNAYSVCLDHITHGLDTTSSNVIFYASLCVLLLSGIITLIYIIKRKPQLLHYEDEEKELSTPKMLKIGFSSPVFIIAAVLFMLDAVIKQIVGVA